MKYKKTLLALISVVMVMGAKSPSKTKLEAAIIVSPDRPEFMVVQVWRVFPSGKIPAPQAPVQVSASTGATWNLTADIRGEAAFPLMKIEPPQNGKDKVIIKALASLDGRETDAKLKLTGEELGQKIKTAAAHHNEQGKARAQKGDFSPP